MAKVRRNPLDKERFLEGNRQKWAGIFTSAGLLVMLATSYGWIKDPAPFLQFFLSIGVTFIIGASATAVMNSWKVSSATSTEDKTDRENRSESKSETVRQETFTTHRVERPKDYDSDDFP